MLVDPFCEGFLLHPVPLIWGTKREEEGQRENPKSSSVPTVSTAQYLDWFVEQNLSSLSHTLTAYLIQNIKTKLSTYRCIHNTTPLRWLHHTYLVRKLEVRFKKPCSLQTWPLERSWAATLTMFNLDDIILSKLTLVNPRFLFFHASLPARYISAVLLCELWSAGRQAELQPPSS